MISAASSSHFVRSFVDDIPDLGRIIAPGPIALPARRVPFSRQDVTRLGGGSNVFARGVAFCLTPAPPYALEFRRQIIDLVSTDLDPDGSERQTFPR